MVIRDRNLLLGNVKYIFDIVFVSVALLGKEHTLTYTIALFVKTIPVTG